MAVARWGRRSVRPGAPIKAVTGARARANDVLQPFSVTEAALASPPRIARAARRTGGTLEEWVPAMPGREAPGRNSGGDP